MCALPIRESMNAIPVYKPAKSSEDSGRDLTRIVRLAANENTLGFSPLAEEAVRRAAARMNWYPDPHSSRLRAKLAEKRGFLPEQLIFGNGSFELLSLAAQAYLNPGEEAIVPSPSFGWYNVATLGAGGVPVVVPLTDHKIDLSAIRERLTPRTRLIWLCNPNNPTGTYFSAGELEAFLAEVPDSVAIVVDEAYYEYADGEDYPDTVRLLERYPNLIAVRTFSKAYGLAGLRIGYGIASPGTIETLNRIRPPLNVNALAEAAAVASLEDTDFVAAVLANNREQKRFYYDSFRELGLAYLPTATNFIMVDLGTESDPVYAEMAQRGVLVRPGSDFGMPTWLRISIGKPDENRRAVELLRQALGAKV